MVACYLLRFDRIVTHDITRAARALRNRNATQLQLYVAVDAAFSEIVIASYALGEQLLALHLSAAQLHASDIEAFGELTPAEDEAGTALAARYGRALDRAKITRRFFADFAGQRDVISDAWIGIPAQRKNDRDQLALLLLSRLMFLYFLQHRGHLANDRSFLLRRVRAGKRVYTTVLKPLFFYVLNRRPHRRPARARIFGDLPYLNGGLFERHPLECKYPRLDLNDECIHGVFDHLLERYRFTAREAADVQLDGVVDLGVDPEMLGRVFEGLMASSVRESTGTFYTPAATVDGLVADALIALLSPRIGDNAAHALVRENDASQLDVYQRQFTSRLLRDARVLDPACGSGAFLLGALSRMARARSSLEDAQIPETRRDIVARSLFGVDVQSDAALLCALRLWLALVPSQSDTCVQPLPSLDRQIRQGDALVDPLDLKGGANDVAVRRGIAELQPLLADYVHSLPEERAAVSRKLRTCEKALSHAWVSALQKRLRYEQADLSALAAQKDLFGSRTREALIASEKLKHVSDKAAELKRLSRRSRLNGDVPFFSFGVHFGSAAVEGFELIVCNPPWVRSHKWTHAMPAVARRRFAVCANGERQVDLALLFLERAIELLAPGGVLGIILPAKFLRSQSAAGARKLLLERTEIVSLEDHSLDQRSIFEADAFAVLLVVRKTPPSPSHTTTITHIKRNGAPLRYTARQRDLLLSNQNGAAPWLLAPPDVRRAAMRMLESPQLTEYSDLAIQRGVMTGNNDVMVLTSFQRKLSTLATITSEGARKGGDTRKFEAVVEESAVSALLRGSDVRPWKATSSRHVICRTPRSARTLPRAARYVEQHGASIPSFACAQCKVVWHDLARTLNAAVVAPEIVPLNTVYFIALPDNDAHVLCAFLNSMPVRVFARAIAERAKDAHFRFFAWTMAMLPLPATWRSIHSLYDISVAAHSAGGPTADAQVEINDRVARAYALTRAELRALADFDEWLST